MSTATESVVRAALLDCYDLEVPCNIVDLGLVLGVLIEEDGSAPGLGIPGVPHNVRVTITVTPVHPDQAAEVHLRAQIANRLAGMEGVSSVSVEVRHSPAWTPARISARGRRTLRLERNPNLVQISSR